MYRSNQNDPQRKLKFGTQYFVEGCYGISRVTNGRVGYSRGIVIFTNSLRLCSALIKSISIFRFSFYEPCKMRLFSTLDELFCIYSP